LENHEPNESYGAGIIAGRNPVAEALRSGRAVDCLYVAKGPVTGQLLFWQRPKSLGCP
jgi:hypothetical protein